jgi:hypothetical protein
MIEKADARARTIVIAAVVTVVLIGVVFLALGDSWRAALIAWILSDPARSRWRAVTVSIAMAAAVILPVVAAAVYLWRFGVRVVRDRRFPPFGTRLIVDMVILEGVEAHRRGRLLQALAIGLAVTSMLFAILFWRLIVLTNPAR